MILGKQDSTEPIFIIPYVDTKHQNNERKVDLIKIQFDLVIQIFLQKQNIKRTFAWLCNFM